MMTLNINLKLFFLVFLQKMTTNIKITHEISTITYIRTV